MSSSSVPAERPVADESVRGASPFARLSEINPKTIDWFHDRGIDIAAGDRIEIGICAQHFQGGIRIDTHARTTVPADIRFSTARSSDASREKRPHVTSSRGRTRRSRRPPTSRRRNGDSTDSRRVTGRRRRRRGSDFRGSCRVTRPSCVRPTDWRKGWPNSRCCERRESVRTIAGSCSLPKPRGCSRSRKWSCEPVRFGPRVAVPTCSSPRLPIPNPVPETKNAGGDTSSSAGPETVRWNSKHANP